MTHANAEQIRHSPWFAKAGAACSIVPISRFVGPNIFALKGGGYGCLFSLVGIDEEGLTDRELDSRIRSIEGALRGLPEGSCLYQYARAMSGFPLPRQVKYANPATEVFATDRLVFLEKSAAFRRIDLHWCLTLEPSKGKAFDRRPDENSLDTSRMLADLEKTAVVLESHLGSSLGLRLLGKGQAFQFFSYLFNLEEWSEQNQLHTDAGVDRQIVNSPVAWHSDHLQVGKRHVQMSSASPDFAIASTILRNSSPSNTSLMRRISRTIFACTPCVRQPAFRPSVPNIGVPTCTRIPNTIGRGWTHHLGTTEDAAILQNFEPLDIGRHGKPEHDGERHSGLDVAPKEEARNALALEKRETEPTV
jgi:hypothetical protein